MTLDLNDIYAEDFPASVRVRMGSVGTIQGFLLDDLNFSFNATYSDQNNLANLAVGTLKNVLSGSFLGSMVGLAGAAFSQAGTHIGRNIFQTLKVWSDSDMSPISLRILVVEKRTGGNLISSAQRTLARAALATRQSIDGGKAAQAFAEGGFMFAPMNYGFRLDVKNAFMGVGATDSSTISLSIGTANANSKRVITGLVASNIQFIESKTRTTEGNPNWLVVQMSLTHYKTVLAEDFNSWIPR